MIGIDEVRRECAALRTRMAARKVTRLFDEALRPVGLRVTQFTLLVAIERGGPESISTLADALGMERTTLTRNLRLLEKAGLIEIGPEGYRRARNMRLTRGGRAALGEALPLWRAAQNRIVDRLGGGKWPAVKASLHDLVEIA